MTLKGSYVEDLAISPFNGRKLPIIGDSILVDPKFGTGAVKVTIYILNFVVLNFFFK